MMLFVGRELGAIACYGRRSHSKLQVVADDEAGRSV
jgi:hypothetical protein